MIHDELSAGAIDDDPDFGPVKLPGAGRAVAHIIAASQDTTTILAWLRKLLRTADHSL
jgi:hypothetical protein